LFIIKTTSIIVFISFLLIFPIWYYEPSRKTETRSYDSSLENEYFSYNFDNGIMGVIKIGGNYPFDYSVAINSETNKEIEEEDWSDFTDTHYSYQSVVYISKNAITDDSQTITIWKQNPSQVYGESDLYQITVYYYSYSSYSIYLLMGLICSYILLLSMYFIENRIIQEHEKNQLWKQTLPGLFDTAQSLSKEAEQVFNRQDYNNALIKYTESYNKFKDAHGAAKGLSQSDMVESIEKAMINIQENISECEFCIEKERVEFLIKDGHELSVLAGKLFKQEKYNEALSKYESSMNRFSDAKKNVNELNIEDLINVIDSSMTELNKNISNCRIGIDRKTVQVIFDDGLSTFNQGASQRKNGEIFKSRDTIKEAENKIEKAFDIASKRNFVDTCEKIKILLEDITTEKELITESIISGAKKIRAERVSDTTLSTIEKTSIDGEPVIDQFKTRRSKRDPTELQLLRETEFIRGFVRMKVAVANTSKTVATDVSLDLHFDSRVLRLDRVEPEYNMVGHKVHLGNLNKGEKKTIAFYLDPQICMTTSVEGVATFKDVEGKMHTCQLRPKEVNVVCPIFFTEESANTAMLRNLVSSELPNHDSKLFTIPDGLAFNDALECAKTALSGREIRFVRDFTLPAPYEAEAWFYGVTKVKKHQLVMKAAILEETNSIEIFVAGTEPSTIAGLLAELGHDLQEKLRERGKTSHQITNITIKDSIINRSTLLFRDEDGDIEIDDSVVNRSEVSK